MLFVMRHSDLGGLEPLIDCEDGGGEIGREPPVAVGSGLVVDCKLFPLWGRGFAILSFKTKRDAEDEWSCSLTSQLTLSTKQENRYMRN